MLKNMKTDELVKWSCVHEDVITIEEFLEWLESRGVRLCEYSSDKWVTRFWPVPKSHRQLLEEYYEIDAAELERERRALLDDAQQQ